MKVLITGGAGFVGTNLSLDLLKNGYGVKIIDDLSIGLKENSRKS
jgi:UDP-glucose 4-epimerase